MGDLRLFTAANSSNPDFGIEFKFSRIRIIDQSQSKSFSIIKEDQVKSPSFLKSLPSSRSPNLLMQLLTQACNYLTFLSGRVSISITYSYRVYRVSKTILQIQARHSVGNFLMFWPRIRLSIIVMFLVSGFAATVFFLSSCCWFILEICCEFPKDYYLRGATSFGFYFSTRSSLIFPFSVLMRAVRQPYKSAASLQVVEDLEQWPYILINRSFMSLSRSCRVQELDQALSTKLSQVHFWGHYILNFWNTSNLLCFQSSSRISFDVSGFLFTRTGGRQFYDVCFALTTVSLSVNIIYFFTFCFQGSQSCTGLALGGSSPSQQDTLFLLLRVGATGSRAFNQAMGTQVILDFFLSWAILLVLSSREMNLQPLGSSLFSLAT